MDHLHIHKCNTFPVLVVISNLLLLYQVSSVKEEERTEQIFFVDMLKKMLHLNPVRRIKPSHLLLHQFLTGFHPVTHGMCAVVINYDHKQILSVFHA